MVASGGLLMARFPYMGLDESESLGYLSVQVGEVVQIFPGTGTAGVAGNLYPSYAFGWTWLGEAQRSGWIPLAVLAANA